MEGGSERVVGARLHSHDPTLCCRVEQGVRQREDGHEREHAVCHSRERAVRVDKELPVEGNVADRSEDARDAQGFAPAQDDGRELVPIDVNVFCDGRRGRSDVDGRRFFYLGCGHFCLCDYLCSRLRCRRSLLQIRLTLLGDGRWSARLRRTAHARGRLLNWLG